VEHVRGTPYRFGMCYHVRGSLSGDDPDAGLFWAWAWVVVRPDGWIEVPHELRPVTHTVQHRRNQTGDRTRGSRTSTVHLREWRAPSLAHMHERVAIDERAKFLKCEFRQLILWWTSREQRWSVGVRKDGRRVTFSVDPQHTSAFFSDRGRQATANGKTRPIIHYVEQHTRANGSVVKAHVRGLSDFDWRGYRCTVVAPKMRGVIATTAPINPFEVDAAEPMDGLLTTGEMAAMMARYEDEPRQPSAAHSQSAALQ
jgi:hypothetical protein